MHYETIQTQAKIAELLHASCTAKGVAGNHDLGDCPIRAGWVLASADLLGKLMPTIAEEIVPQVREDELAKVTAERDEARRKECSAPCRDVKEDRDHWKKRYAELENALNWNTTCLGCSQTLDGAYVQTMRAETAEAERDTARREAEQARAERDAYRRAKAENDERFQLERDTARLDARRAEDDAMRWRGVADAMCWAITGSTSRDLPPGTPAAVWRKVELARLLMIEDAATEFMNNVGGEGVLRSHGGDKLIEVFWGGGAASAAAPQATAPDHARYPHARCPEAYMHAHHIYGDPIHYCDGSGLSDHNPARADADDLDVHLAEQMTDPAFAAAYRARQAAAPQATSIRPCGQPGLHDPHGMCPGIPLAAAPDADSGDTEVTA